MENKNHETEIRMQDLWGILKRSWWQMGIVLIAVFLLVLGFMTATHKDEYTVSLMIYVMQTPDEDQQLSNTTQIAIAENLMGDCELLFKSREKVLDPVISSENLGGLITAKELERMFTVSRVDEDARILRLTLTSGSRERSADIANAIANTACGYINGLYRTNLLDVYDKAVAPEEGAISNPISYPMIFLIGMAAALILYLFYLIRFIMDDKINTRDDVERYLGLNMLGVIPNKYDTGRRRSANGNYYSYRSPENNKKNRS